VVNDEWTETSALNRFLAAAFRVSAVLYSCVYLRSSAGKSFSPFTIRDPPWEGVLLKSCFPKLRQEEFLQ
jgi:hypothetical protein